MSNRTREYKNAPDLKTLIEQMGAKSTEAIKQLTDRLDDLELKAKRPGAGGGSESKGDLAAEYKALGAYVRTNVDSEIKALSASNNTEGGYLVPPAISEVMTKRIFDQSPLRRLSRVIPVGAGDVWMEPYDHSDVGVEWIGEKEERPATATPTIGATSIPINEMYGLQPVYQRLIDDAWFNIGAWVVEKVSDKIGRAEGLACVSGNGIKKPEGFMTRDKSASADLERPWGTLQYVVSGSGGVIADPDGGANGLKNLFWALRSPYRANASWLMNSATANAIDLMKDGNDQYIWRPGLTAGAPASLLSRPVEICEDMPGIGAGTYPVAFGDFKQGYTIVDKLGVRWHTDPYTVKGQVQFYAYRRTGGGLTNSDAIKLLKIST